MKKLKIIASLIVLCQMLYSQTTGDYRSKSSGVWSTAGNWESYNGISWVTASSSPSSTNGVITVMSPHTMDITSSISIDQCIIQYGGTVTISSGGTATLTIVNGAGIDLELNGLLRLDAGGAISMSTGSNLTVNSGGVYQHNRNFTNGLPAGGNTTWNAGSLCLISSDITFTTTFSGHSFSRLNINYSTGTLARVFEADWPTSLDTLNIINTGTTGTLSIANSANSRIRELGTLIVDGGKFYLAGTSASGAGSLPFYSLTITNNLIQNGGELEINRANNSGANARPTFNVNGNMDLKGGLFRIMNNSGTGAAIGELNIIGNLNINGGTLDISAAGTTNAGRCNLTNNLNLSSGELKYTQALTGSTASSGIYFNGTSSQSFIYSGGVLSTASGGAGRRFYYKTSSGPTGLNEEYSGTTLQSTVSGTEGTPVSGFSSWPTSGTILKNFTINNSSGVDIRDNRTINTTLFRTAGGLTGTGIISYASGATLNYNGTSAMTTTDKEFPSSNSPTNLTINNANHITLHADKTISGTLNLITGKLITGTCNSSTSNVSLIMDDNSTVSGGNNNSFVDGILKKIGNDAFTFPIGSGSIYAPAGIDAPSVTTDRFAACYNASNPNSLYSISSKVSTLNNVSKMEYWFINREAGTSSTNVTLSWDTRSGGVSNLTSMRVSRWDGTQWTDLGQTSVSGTTTSGIITSSSVSSFSPFTLASTNNANSLPVELIKFYIDYIENSKIIKWETASEYNNDYFEISKSEDAIQWKKIGIIKSSGNSQSLQSYEIKDDFKIEGIYYKLKQVDNDGKEKEFEIITSKDKFNSTAFDFYFVQNEKKIKLKGVDNNSNIEISIYNLQGKIVNANFSSLDLSSLDPNIYFICIKCNGNIITKKINIEP